MAQPSLTTRAELGFVARCKRGTTIPIGETEMHLEDDAIKLVSTSYQWLVVSGAQAQFQGQGKVNGQTGYTFMVTAIDGALGGGADQIRVKIWRTSGGQIVYDSQIGASDTAYPTTSLGGGQVKIKR